jgi:hypothetical protein
MACVKVVVGAFPESYRRFSFSVCLFLRHQFNDSCHAPGGPATIHREQTPISIPPAPPLIYQNVGSQGSKRYVLACEQENARSDNSKKDLWPAAEGNERITRRCWKVVRCTTAATGWRKGMTLLYVRCYYVPCAANSLRRLI